MLDTHQFLALVRRVWEPVSNLVPRWLFTDEAVASLDITPQLDVMRRVRDWAFGGGGVITVMHDLNLTAMVADSDRLLDDGRIAATGTPAAVFGTPAVAQACG